DSVTSAGGSAGLILLWPFVCTTISTGSRVMNPLCERSYCSLDSPRRLSASVWTGRLSGLTSGSLSPTEASSRSSCCSSLSALSSISGEVGSSTDSRAAASTTASSTTVSTTASSSTAFSTNVSSVICTSASFTEGSSERSSKPFAAAGDCERSAGSSAVSGGRATPSIDSPRSATGVSSATATARGSEGASAASTRVSNALLDEDRPEGILSVPFLCGFFRALPMQAVGWNGACQADTPLV